VIWLGLADQLVGEARVAVGSSTGSSADMPAELRQITAHPVGGLRCPPGADVVALTSMTSGPAFLSVPPAIEDARRP
jgi:hypothetical protein